MTEYIIASHAHLSQGLVEALSFLAGEREDVHVLTPFVDGHLDVEGEVQGALDRIPDDRNVIVCTDILGGSVNNEFVKALARRPRTYVVTNMNLPTVISLVFSGEGRDPEELIREVLAQTEVQPTFVNDFLAEQAENDDDF